MIWSQSRKNEAIFFWLEAVDSRNIKDDMKIFGWVMLKMHLANQVEVLLSQLYFI